MNNDELRQIFRFLSVHERVFLGSRVCKQWRRVAREEHFWKEEIDPSHWQKIKTSAMEFFKHHPEASKNKPTLYWAIREDWKTALTNTSDCSLPKEKTLLLFKEAKNAFLYADAQAIQQYTIEKYDNKNIIKSYPLVYRVQPAKEAKLIKDTISSSLRLMTDRKGEQYCYWEKLECYKVSSNEILHIYDVSYKQGEMTSSIEVMPIITKEFHQTIEKETFRLKSP